MLLRLLLLMLLLLLLPLLLWLWDSLEWLDEVGGDMLLRLTMLCETSDAWRAVRGLCLMVTGVPGELMLPLLLSIVLIRDVM